MDSYSLSCALRYSLPASQIQWVITHSCCVTAHVHADGQHISWVQPRTSIDSRLANRDAHAMHAQVTVAQILRNYEDC
jgi:hypothetical protein